MTSNPTNRRCFPTEYVSNYRVFETLQEDEYDLLSYELTGHELAEMRIEPATPATA